jgi:hypothetical protein
VTNWTDADEEKASQQDPPNGWYVKKPIPALCIQWGKLGDHEAVQSYTFVTHVPYEDRCEVCAHKNKYHGWISTLEAGHRVCPGDWIVRGIDGELWPVKHDIFIRTYERTEDQ